MAAVCIILCFIGCNPSLYAQLRFSSYIAPLEAEIDRLVYQLYGLSAEEIAVVEGKG